MEILVPTVALAAAFCLVNPMTGLLVVIGAGFVQDPIRKVLPGNAFFMVLLAFVLFSFCALGLVSRGGLRRLRSSPTFRLFRGPVIAILVLVATQTVHSFLRWGSPVVSAIGFLSYLGPIAAASAGYLLALRQERLLRFLRAYVIWGTLAAATVLAARFLPDVGILKPIGGGITVYGENLQVKLASGLLRTPEVAAWHAATTGCLVLLLLTLQSRGRRQRSLALGVPALGVVVLAILFTGRRKALVEVAFFAVVYLFFLVRLKQGSRRLLVALLLTGGLVGYQLMQGTFAAGDSRETAHLVSRGGSVAVDSSTRLVLALRSAGEALQRYGVIGLGAGSAAQGTQYFGGDSSVGLVAEPGAGRIAAELGLFGLVIAGWLVARLGGELRYRVGALARREPEVAKLGLGLLSLLLANTLIFVTASQIFGDPFVYLMLGIMAGAVIGLVDGTVEVMAIARRSRGDMTPAAVSSAVGQ